MFYGFRTAVKSPTIITLLAALLFQFACIGEINGQEQQGGEVEAGGAAPKNPSGAGEENFAAAESAYRAGKYPEALALLGNTAENSTRAALLYARACLMCGKYERGLALGPVAAAENNGEASLLCVKGELLMKLGRLDEAAALFDRAWRESHYARAWCFRHEVAKMRGEKKLAAKIEDDFFNLHEATPVTTDNPMIFAYVGRVIEDIAPEEETPYDALNHGYALAQKLLKKSGRYEPEAWLWSGDLLMRYYAFSQVAAEYNVVLKQTPNHPDALCGVAELYMQRGDFQKAGETIEKVLEVNPRHERALLLRAYIMLSRFAPPEEITKLLAGSVLKTNPYCLDGWALLAAQKLLREDPDGFENIRKRVLGLEPEEATVFSADEIDRLYEILDSPPPLPASRTSSSLDSFDKGKLALDNAGELAWSLLKQGRFKKAEMVAEKVAARQPKNLYAWLTLNYGLNPDYTDFYCVAGEMLQVKFREPVARRLFERALRINIVDWRANYDIGMSLSRLGYTEQARDHIVTSFRMNPYNVQAKNTKVVLFKLVGGEAGGRKIKPKFKTFETRNFRFRIFTDEIEILEPYLKDLMEKTRTEYDGKWNFQPTGINGKILVEVFPTRDDFSVGTTGLPDLPAFGATFGSVITLVSPKTSVNGELPSFNWRAVFRHEYMHCITLQLSEFKIPRWATEAVSVYSENDPHIAQDQLFVDCYENGLIPKLSEFEDGFTREKFPGCVSLHYFLAGLYMHYWMDNYGLDKVRQMCVAWRNGNSDDEVFRKVFKKSIDEMNEELWEKVIDPLRESIPRFPSPTREMFEALKQMHKDTPGDVKVAGELALDRLRFGDIPGAVELAREVTRAQPDHPLANTVLAVAARIKPVPDWDASLRYADKALSGDPRFFYALQAAGIACLELQQPEKSVRYLETTVEVYPRHKDSENLSVYHLLAKAYVQLGRKKDALDLLMKLGELDPSDLNAAKKALGLAVELGDTEATKTAVMRGIFINPYEVSFHKTAGDVFYGEGDWKEALREYRVATVIAPDNAELWEKAAKAALAAGDEQSAREAANKALEIRAGSIAAREVLDALDAK